MIPLSLGGLLWLARRRRDPAAKEKLKESFAAAHLKATVEVFPGTHHGFCFPERAVYDTLASEATWSKIFALWDRHLK